MRFLDMLRQGGSLHDERILSPKTVDFMIRDHLPCRLTNANYGDNRK